MYTELPYFYGALGKDSPHPSFWEFSRYSVQRLLKSQTTAPGFCDGLLVMLFNPFLPFLLLFFIRKSDAFRGIKRKHWEVKGKSGFLEGSETQPGPPQTSKMESFATIVNGFLSTTVIKLSILDVYGVPEYVSQDCLPIINL